MSVARAVTVFHYTGCSTCRKAVVLIDEAATEQGVTVEKIEYMKHPLTDDQIRDILGFLGADKDASIFKSFLRKTAPTATSVEEVQAILKEDIKQLERPLAVDWERKMAVIGRPSEAILDILKPSKL